MARRASRCAACGLAFDAEHQAIPFGELGVCGDCKDAFAQGLRQGEPLQTSDEKKRQGLLGTEDHLRAIGFLVFFLGLCYVGYIIAAWDPFISSFVPGVVGWFDLIATVLVPIFSLPVVIGLIGLKRWAIPACRIYGVFNIIAFAWPDKGVSSLGMTLLVVVLNLWLIWFMHRPKVGEVLSLEYKRLVFDTPWVEKEKAKSSPIVDVVLWVFIIGFLAFLGLSFTRGRF